MHKALILTITLASTAVLLMCTLLAQTAAQGQGVSGTVTLRPAVDAYLASGQPNDPHDTRGLFVGRAASGPDAIRALGNTRTLLRFDLADLRFVRITGATLRLWLTYTCCAPDNPLPVAAQRVTTQWDQNVTWNNAPALTDLGVVQNAPVQPNVWVEWQIPPDVVQQWVDTPANNFGVALVSLQGETTGKLRNFPSSDFADNPDLQPQLVVTYEEIPDPTLAWQAQVRPAGAVQSGALLTYTVAYTNTGSGRTLASVAITGTIPAGATYVPGTSNSGEPQNGVIVKRENNLAAQASGVLAYSVRVANQPITLPTVLALGGQLLVDPAASLPGAGLLYTCPVTVTLVAQTTPPITTTLAVTTGLWSHEVISPALSAPVTYTVQVERSPEMTPTWEFITANPLTVTLPGTGPQAIGVNFVMTPVAGLEAQELASLVCQPPAPLANGALHVLLTCGSGSALLDPVQVGLRYRSVDGGLAVTVPFTAGVGEIGNLAPGVYTVTLQQAPVGWQVASAATRTVKVLSAPAATPVVSFQLAPIVIGNQVDLAYSFENRDGTYTWEKYTEYLLNAPTCSRLYLPNVVQK